MHTKKDEGFTLVELLIVIVILGILATVTVFAVGGITQTARENTCTNEVATVETAIAAFHAQSEGNAFPDPLNILWNGTADFDPILRERPAFMPTDTTFDAGFGYAPATGVVTSACTS